MALAKTDLERVDEALPDLCIRLETVNEDEGADKIRVGIIFRASELDQLIIAEQPREPLL